MTTEVIQPINRRKIDFLRGIGMKPIPLNEDGKPAIKWGDICDHDWPPGELRNHYDKFVNVATCFGRTTANTPRSKHESLFLNALDIDSEAVYGTLEAAGLIEEWKKKTYVVKTRKPYGLHVYWLSREQYRPINPADSGNTFEIKTDKSSGLATLPDSKHRDHPEEEWRYSEVGQKSIVFDDEMYGVIIAHLKEFLDDEARPGQVYNPFEDRRAEDSDKIAYLVEEIIHKHKIKTLRDTNEILYYRDGIYHRGGEFLVREEMHKLAGYKLKNVMRNEVLQTIRDKTGVDRAGFDSDPYILNLKNCLLDLRTLKPRDHTPDYLSVVQIPVNYDPEAKCPNFVKFLRSTLEPEHSITILKMMGYILLRNTMFEKGFILVGEGANGKSTLIKLIIKLLGKNNTSGRSVQELAGGDRFAKADLFGKMANLYADLPKGKILDTGEIKMLTSGDPMTAQNKYGQPFTLENYAKFVFSCNEIPQSYDNSYAYMRRWVIVPFNHTFEGDAADEGLLDKLTAELSGIFNLALCGLRKLQADRGFKEVDINEIKRQYEMGASRIRDFLDNKCIIEPGNENLRIEPERLREAYRNHCKELGTTFFNESDLGKELKALDIEHKQKGPRSNKQYYYFGIQLKEETL